jgi:cytochrome c553
MGDDAMGTPRLAGQVYQFVVKQLEDFATDKRQDTTMFVMNANAKGLTPQDRIDVSAYVNSLPMASGKLSNLTELSSSGTEVGETHLGKAIVNYGLLDKGVPACASCHGYNGRGTEPVYPRIGQQKYTYLVNQLKKWRDGSRANDPMGQMQAVARKMSDDDIHNAAAYLAGASPLTMGNTRVPTEHKPYDH